MDSFTLNKIAGAVLGTCLVGLGLGIVGQEIFSPAPPKKPGYALPEPKTESAGAGGAAEKGGPALPVLLAKADPKRGEADTKVCQACHNFQEGAGAKVGPDLYGVVDRDKGSVQGFDYSAGMKAKGGKWTFADINEFITKPSAYVQGTKMGYAGEENPEKRADIIVYLRTLSKSPVPLPAAAAGDKTAGAGDKPADAAGKPAGAAAGGDDDKIVKLVASADPKKGQADAQVCSACHNLKKGAGSLVGPELWGVVDRPKGSFPGFEYSAGMKAKGGNWTYADLNQFLTKPQAYVQGTKMGYPGEANEKKRADIIAFLRTLADTPAPLPGAGDKAAGKDAGVKDAGAKDAGAKPLPADAKPGAQSPPPPPNKPGAPQPEPKKAEPSEAPGAPTQSAPTPPASPAAPPPAPPAPPPAPPAPGK